eukprot:527209-Prymnesium_polylepis.1
MAYSTAANTKQRRHGPSSASWARGTVVPMLGRWSSCAVSRRWAAGLSTCWGACASSAFGERSAVCSPPHSSSLPSSAPYAR